MFSGIDPVENARQLRSLVAEAAAGGAAMIFTPEMSGLLDRDRTRAARVIRYEQDDQVLCTVRAEAKKNRIWVQLGSLAITNADNPDGKWLNRSYLINPEGERGEIQGASWGGESDILGRLIQPVFEREENGNFRALPQFQIPWQFFTLQDAIDFAVFAIQTTIDCVKFFPRPKTVGGPIDVLVVTREKAFWVSKKQLKINTRE